MAHARKQLRDAAKASLAGVASVSGVRMYERNLDALPALEVSTPAEAVERLSDDGALARDISLSVAAILAPSGDVEDAADALGEAVEAAIHGMAAAAPWAASILSISTEFDPGEPGERRPAVLTTLFQVRVYAEEDDPQTLT